MNLAGLSSDKAPPVEAPLGLFYLMPLFLALAGLVLVWQGEQVLASRWTPAALAATHFVVLGALAPVMCGALLQISPVLLGAPYPRVLLVARLTAAGLGVGSLLIGLGFLAGMPGLLFGGGCAAGLGLLVFLVSSYHALAAAAGRAETRWAVRLAVIALAVTIGLGLTLAMARLGWLTLPQHLRWVDTHVAWGLAGWVGLLLAGIGMEIIPLFYITPAFVGWVKRALPFMVFALLLLASALGLPAGDGHPLLTGVLAALFLAHLLYNLAALYVEQRRQRPRRDANLWLWQASHLAVIAAFVGWLAGSMPSLVGVLLLGGALCFVIGSLIKIVPFLSWLDLQQRRVAGQKLHVGLPRLTTLLPKRAADAIALSLGAAVFAVPAGAFLSPLAQAGGGLLLLSAGLLGYVLAVAARIRHAVMRELDAPPGAAQPH